MMPAAAGAAWPEVTVSWLSQVREPKRRVGVPPGLLEFLPHEDGLIRPVLRCESSHQPEQRAAIAPVPLEVRTEDPLRLRVLSVAQEGDRKSTRLNSSHSQI